MTSWRDPSVSWTSPLVSWRGDVLSGPPPVDVTPDRLTVWAPPSRLVVESDDDIDVWGRR